MTLTVTKHSPTYWRVTLNNPPINLYDQQFVEHLQALTEQLENDDEVNIVVFGNVSIKAGKSGGCQKSKNLV
jgi:enoyl-CoA hydratase/carnithine racemase